MEGGCQMARHGYGQKQVRIWRNRTSPSALLPVMPHPLINPSGHWMRDVLQDEEVVRRVLDGERELFELIVRRHNQRLFRTIRSIVRSAERAEEVLQRTYVSAWRRLETFEGRAPLVAWLSRIAVRAAEGYLRDERRRSGVEPQVEELDTSSTQPGPVDAFAAEELRVRLEEAVSGLPAEYRSVFVLRVSEQLSTAEVASLLRISANAVKVRLHRARDQLRGRLGRSYDDAAFDTVWQFDGERCDRIVARVMAIAARDEFS